jgi:tetratricopeptide (TPR) repeat protein
MNLEKLKDTARKLEQKEDWRKAIEVYLKAIQQAESGAETTPDLSLYNRVGDLYLKINDTSEAVRSYERAVDLYADQGFFNNAIALCGKILRVNPGRTQTYLKLAQLHARKNVVIEAKRNLIEFLERMNALGQLDQAFQAVKLFADQFSGSQEIRSMLVELLRATSREDEAREQLEKMAVDLEAIGDKAGARRTRERLNTIETEPPHPAAPSPAPSSPRRGDLIFLDTGVDVAPPPSSLPPPRVRESHQPVREAPTPPVPEPEPISLVEESLPAASEPVDDLIIEPLVPEQPAEQSDDPLLGIERLGDSLYGGTVDLDAPLEIQRQEAPDLTFDSMPLEGMEGTSLGAFSGDQPSALDLPGEYMVSLPDSEDVLEISSEQSGSLDPDLGNVESLPDSEAVLEISPEQSGSLDPYLGNVDLGVEPPDLTRGLPQIGEEEPGTRTLAELEDRVLDDPENPDVHLEMAEGLIAAGETGRVAEELELALAGYEDREDWARAADMANRLVQLAPDSVGHHQKRVELAYRAGDRGPLLEAYLGLGDALAKSDALDKAIAVYGRVIEHDPRNARAAAALRRLGANQAEEPRAPPPPTPPPAASPKAVRPVAPAPPQPAPPPPAARTSSPQAGPSPAAGKTPAAPAQSSPPRAAPVSSGDFVDLGSMILEDENRRDTRMRVNRREPSHGDEQREFHEILEQFKRGIDQNLDSEDHQAHYDLGIAFKEMGLLDEAIGEFQKALRAHEGRLRTSEALGMAFFEKGQYAVCESVLKRAVENLDGTDEAKIGLLYWMGRASEALGKEADAMASYERAMMVDIRFMDLSQRMQRLTGGRRR